METRQHTWQKHSGKVLAERHGGTVIACEACGFHHAVPLPAPSEVHRLYTVDFYDHKHTNYIASQKRDLQWRRLEFAAKFDVFEESLATGRRRLLDVGSGPGWFLQYGQERGWDVVGVEPGTTACEFSRGELNLQVVSGFFEASNVADLEPFDVVHLNNVLEHVTDPAGLLDLAGAVLQPGGLVCVSVPNDFNPLQEALVKLRGHPQWWVDPREHLNYFNRASLAGLLERQGFTLRRELGSFPLELFALMGEDYLADPALGGVIHGRRKVLELAMAEAGQMDLLREMYEKLSRMGLGRLLTLVGER